MLEWLIIFAIAALLIRWLLFQKKRPCSGCDGCTTNCSLNFNKNEVHHDEKENT